MSSSEQTDIGAHAKTRLVTKEKQIEQAAEDTSSGRPGGWRAPIVRKSILLTVLLAAVTISVAVLVAFQGNTEHWADHWSLALPALMLGGLILFTWPPLAHGRTAQVVHWLLIAGLALFGFGQLVEGLGAFGYEQDGHSEANDLVVVHAIGVGMTAIGIAPVLAGLVLSGGVVVADLRGAAGSKVLFWFVVAAIGAVVAFEGGALIFGY